MIINCHLIIVGPWVETWQISCTTHQLFAVAANCKPTPGLEHYLVLGTSSHIVRPSMLCTVGAGSHGDYHCEVCVSHVPGFSIGVYLQGQVHDSIMYQ